MLACSCSNPFSSQSASILKENAKPQNTFCSDVRFDQSEFTAKQLRAVIHCLNQNHDLEEIELWTHDISDDELSPWILELNSILKNEPEFLYGLKQVYLNQRDQGAIQNFIHQFFSRVQVNHHSDELVSLMKNHSPWIQETISTHQYKINFQKLSLLSDVKAFNRGAHELWDTGRLIDVMNAIHRYHRSTGALSFQELYQFFGDTPPGAISDPKSVEKISGMINWLLAGDKLDIFSKAAETLIQKPISCFQNGKIVTNPLNVLVSELTTIQAEEAPDFLRKRIPAVLLLAEPYCTIPSEVLSAATLLQQSADLDALPAFFSFTQPLLKNQKFMPLLAATSFRQLGKDLAAVNDTHFFQDLTTLINWFQKNPVSESNTSTFLDSLFDEFSTDEMQLILELVPQDSHFFLTLQEMDQTLPSLQKTPPFPRSTRWLELFTKKSFAPALLLLNKMNDEKKIIPIADRMIELFQKMLDRGRSQYHATPIHTPEHSNATSSQTWQLVFLLPPSTRSSTAIDCGNVDINWNFTQISTPFSSDAYLHQLNELGACYGGNQSFLAVSDLARYLVGIDPSGATLKKLTSIESDFLNFIFALGSSPSLDLFSQILTLNDHDRSEAHQLITSSSNVLRQSKSLLKSSRASRKLFGTYLSKYETFAAILKQRNYPQPLSFPQGSHKNELLLSIALKGLPDLFSEYCPDSNPNSSSCQIESEQVNLYQQSPEKLAKKILEEYLTSPETWAHPLEFKGWDPSSGLTPKKVSELEYHLNPLIKQTQDHTGPMNGIFNFLIRNSKSDTNILTFLNEKSSKFFLIPYIFENPTYPENQDEEFHHQIRLRIVSDLDRLELLAINTDFKPFGILKNFGLTSLREIATSWGDVPSSQRPLLGSDETLQMARNSILKQFSKYNLSLLQRYGHRGTLGDIRARMFNLKSMLTVLDDPKELVFLRDLFYSLYEQNSKSQMGVYGNGVKESPECLSPQHNGDDHCQRDLLGMIPHIARMGLLHQAGLSLWNAHTDAVQTIISILSEANHQGNSTEISQFISTPAGEQTLRDVLSLAQSLNPAEQLQVSLILKNASKISNQEWISFALRVLKNEPKLFSIFSPTIHSALLNTTTGAISPEMNTLLSSFSNDLKDHVYSDEISRLLANLGDSQNSIQNILRTQFSVDFSVEWLELLAKPENQKEREQLSTFITGNGFDNFCDVFSDAVFTEKTYIFLDKLHQNSGASELLEECRRFLH